MRADAMGMFWFDEPPKPKEKKEKVKREPPDRLWEAADYLPGLAEARAFPVELYTWEGLVDAALKKEPLIFDIECYPNYFLIAFEGERTGKVVYTECGGPAGFEPATLNFQLLLWIFKHCTIVGFNSMSYDMVMAAIALTGVSTLELKEASDMIIVEQMRPSDVLRRYGAKKLDTNHIDLIEVAPLRASLKLYGGRLHVPKMQDLPVKPDQFLSLDQITIVRWYCVNDLRNTIMLKNELSKQLELRANLSREYNKDLLSKSDAQIAEAVIGDAVGKLNGRRSQRPTIPIGTVYRYNIPNFIQFQTPLLNEMLRMVYYAEFVVGDSGAVGLPKELADFAIEIGQGVYRMGIGGLHSSESAAAHVAGNGYVLRDRDVTSYYPMIILNQGLYPQHLGPAFLEVYRGIVNRRLAAKRAKDKVTADSLKITINGSFGKLGSKYSILYAPDLLIQTTITGQLSLLMLIEAFELSGMQVVSANTDGIVVKFHESQYDLYMQVVRWWERATDFETEETKYSALYSRDVNNYIALKDPATVEPGDDRYKAKGIFAEPGLSKNPQNLICTDAVAYYLLDGTPIETTVMQCSDITRFITVRTVTGGAVKLYGPQHDEKGKRLEPPQEYLGKAIRWYYGTGVEGEIVYAKSGNKVPRSDGARPLMELPPSFPDDVDAQWYINESYKILTQIGLEDPRPPEQ